MIEKADGPTPWVSPIVLLPKKGQNKIRICIDTRAANKAIKRKRHPTHTLNELKTILSGANVFSKLDLNQGYNQLELAEESRYITTFATHLGLYRYKRLLFCVNSASEIFQEEISQALTGIKGAINISDDILCFGSDQQDHDQNLHAIFRRLREKGLTLNSSKCEYNKRSLEFLGHTFGKEGISPSDLKIKAILGLPLWPQANGETERFMRTVKKSIKAALNKGRSWKQELFKFLLDYRTTPHCTTGAPPAIILFGRTIKNRLPHLITPIAEDSNIRERDTEAKRKIKQYAV